MMADRRRLPAYLCAECGAQATTTVETYVNGRLVTATLVCSEHRDAVKLVSAVLSHVERPL